MKYILILSLFLLAGYANSDDAYPENMDDLLYFSARSAWTWGDPLKKDIFRVIRVINKKISTENNTYSTIDEFLASNEIKGIIGIAIDFKDYWNDEKKDGLIEAIKQKGITRVVEIGSREWTEAFQVYLDRTTGNISGTIRSSETGNPMAGVHVSTRHVGDGTDEHGRFTIGNLAPGTIVLEASKLGVITKKLVEKVEIRKTKEVELQMELAPAACCKLDGEWSLVLHVEADRRCGKNRPKTKETKVVGSISFGDMYPNPFSKRQIETVPGVHLQFGKYEVDLAKILGANYTPSISTSRFGGESGVDLRKQALGTISDANVVRIVFIPGLSHGGLTLNGKIESNRRIYGDWYKRGYGQEKGTFRMRRMRNKRAPNKRLWRQ